MIINNLIKNIGVLIIFKPSMFFLFLIFSCCSVQKQEKQILSSDKNTPKVFLYEIKIDTLLSDKNKLRLEILTDIKFIKGQETISYNYCSSLKNCDTIFKKVQDGKTTLYNDELTGRIVNNDSYWLHPPRSGYFKILELNAFPYYKKNVKEWCSDITFGEEWGDKRWNVWSGLKIAQSYYSLSDSVVYFKVNNLTLKCSKITAKTVIEGIGKTESVFYFNEVYGFVYMCFKTINDKHIELKMI